MTKEKNKKQEKIEFEVDLKGYSKDAIYASAYSFLDEIEISLKIASVSKESEVKKSGQKKVVVVFEKKPQKECDLEKIKKEFLKELLYSAIRNNLSAKHRKIREAIVAQALFSAAGGFEQASNCNDSAEDTESEDVKSKSAKNSNEGIENDPLGISLAWEDKYSKK